MFASINLSESIFFTGVQAKGAWDEHTQEE